MFFRDSEEENYDEYGIDYDELRKMSDKEIYQELTDFKEKIERDANMKKDEERWYDKWGEKECRLLSNRKMAIIFQYYTKEDFNYFLELQEGIITNYLVINIAKYKEDFSYVITYYNDKTELCLCDLYNILSITKPSQEDFKKFLKGRKFDEDFYKYKSLIPEEYMGLVEKHKISQENEFVLVNLSLLI